MFKENHAQDQMTGRRVSEVYLEIQYGNVAWI
jgi:hypothetical protein